MNELTKFLSWKTLVFDKSVELTQHREIYDKFKEYINSIIKTGFLPESIIDYTDDFMNKIVFSIANSLLNCDITNSAKSEIKMIKLYFNSFFKLGIYGALSHEKSALSVLSLLLSQNNKPLFKENKHKLMSDLLRKFYSKGAIESFQISIESSQNIELLALVLELTSKIVKYDPVFQDQRFFEISMNAIKRIVSSNKEIVIVKFLVSSLDSIQSIIPYSDEANTYFVNEVLPILAIFITSLNLEQRSNALSQFLKYAKIPLFMPIVVKFFSKSNKFSLFSSVSLHDSLSQKIGELMSIIISNSKSIGKPGIIIEIWNRHGNGKKKSFELSTFYDTFLHLGSYLENDLFDEFIDAVLSGKPSFAWFEMIDKLPTILSKRKGMKKAFKKIREKLWNLINSSNDDNNKYLQSLQQNVKNSIIHIIGFNADESDLKQIKSFQETDQYYFYELLNSFLENKNIIEKKTVSEFLINLLTDLSPSNHSPIMIKDIKQLCELSGSLSSVQLDLLVNSIEYFPDFFKFMKSLNEKSILKQENVIYISNKINKKFVDLGFYIFIKEFINQRNPLDRCITKLPINHEKLIWKYAITESPVRIKFAKLLSRIYITNDGKQLSDGQVIDHFLNKWEKYFIKKQENQEKVNNLLHLLWTFIDKYESNMYRDVNIFGSPLSIERTFDVYSVNAICEKPEFNLNLKYPNNYTIESIVEEIHEKFDIIGLNNTDVFLNGAGVKRSALIRELAEDSDSIVIELKIDKEAKIPHDYHIRTTIPSRVIIERNWHKKYFEELIENGNKYAYEVIKLLPSDSNKLNIEEKLNNGNSTAYFEDILNIQIPYQFSYNLLLIYFESINNQRLLNQLFEEGIIKYLSDIITELDPESIYIEICDVFNYIIRNILKFVRFDKTVRNNLIFTLLTLVEKGFNLNAIKLTFGILLNYNINELNFESFPHIRLLFHPNHQIRTFAVEVFNDIQIDLNEYLIILREHNDEVNENFIHSLANHISYDIDQETVYEIADIIMQLQTENETKNGQFLESSLTLFQRFLSFNFLNFEKRQLILQLIIDRLLTTEFDDDDSIAFDPATKCLAELANTETYSLHKIFDELHSNREPFTEYNINGSKCSISKTGRVGLKRIGNTCYFNTIMQMLFSIKPIRNIIMTYKGDDDFLNEVSKLFVLMKYVKARSINTDNVLNYLTDSNGDKVNISDQQDAAEFLQNIINRIQDVEKLFSGSLVDIYEGIFDDFIFEKEELFTILDLDVQNIESLYKSFESYTKSSDLTGSNQFYDDESKKKIDVKKHSKIKTAPPFLIIHLKRFESIDYENIGAKIDDVFEIPFEFDISPFSTQQIPIYKLTGVIVHNGTSSCGHYYCLSLTKNGWIKIDDVNSIYVDQKDVVKLIQGETSQGNAYILFFTMETDLQYTKQEIDPNLLEYAERMNKMNNEKRLFCSMNYFRIIEMLNNLIQIDFNDIVLRYTIDSLPFMCIKDEEYQTFTSFYKNLFKKSKMSGFVLIEKFSFLDYSLNYLKEDLLLCPNKFIRKKTADLILLNLDEKADPHRFLIIDIAKESLNYPTQFNEIFYLIYCILKDYKELKESNQVQNTLYNLLAKDLIPFIINTQNFSDVDMTYILEIVIMYNVYNKLNKNDFLYQLLMSDTCIDSVFNFVKLTFNDDENEIKKFVEKNISQISIQKFIPFYFFFNPKEAIQFSFQKLDSKNLNVSGIRLANECDLVCIFNDMLSKCYSLSKFFLKGLGIWVPRILFNPKSIKIRKIALSIFSYIIPHDNLIKWHFINNPKLKSNQPKIFFDFNFASIKENSPPNVNFDRICCKVLNYLLKKDTINLICNVFNDKDIDECFCVEYLELIEEVLIFNSKEFDSKELKNLLKLFECIVKYIKNPFSDSLIRILSIIFKFKIQVSQSLLESSLKETKTFSNYFKNKSNLNNLLNYLTYFFQIYSNFEPSESFLNKFVSYYLFSPEMNWSWTPVVKYLKSILVKKKSKNSINSKSQKIADYILGVIDSNFKIFAINNYSSLLFILNRIRKVFLLNDEVIIQKVKKPLLLYFKYVIEKPQYLNINKIIKIAFTLNNGGYDKHVIQSVFDKYRYDINDDNLNLLKTINDEVDISNNNNDDNNSNVSSLGSSDSYSDYSN